MRLRQVGDPAPRWSGVAIQNVMLESTVAGALCIDSEWGHVLYW